MRGASLRLAAGESPAALGLDGWQITDCSLVLGHGREDFIRATDRLLTWRAHAHARVHASRSGDTVTLRIGPTSSPCRILREKRTSDATVLVYGTLPGHVENGEEAFLIGLAHDGTVTGRCVAFSRPARCWARLGAPVTRLAQLTVTAAYLRGMRP